jgi:hypothetical protein
MRELYSIQVLGGLQSAAVTDRRAAQTRPDGAFNIMLLNSHNTLRYKHILARDDACEDGYDGSRL